MLLFEAAVTGGSLNPAGASRTILFYFFFSFFFFTSFSALPFMIVFTSTPFVWCGVELASTSAVVSKVALQWLAAQFLEPAQ